jgi:hypothetical protein
MEVIKFILGILIMLFIILFLIPNYIHFAIITYFEELNKFLNKEKDTWQKSQKKRDEQN